MILLIVLLFCAAVAGVIFYGERRWRADGRTLRHRLEAARQPHTVRVFDPRELESLPAPVQRYFRAVLAAGQPVVAGVQLGQTGRFNLNEATGHWRPFTATQRVITCRPGFDWDARIALLPGLSGRVHDAYVAGEGFLHAAVFGLVSVVNLRGGGELARGELMRFLRKRFGIRPRCCRARASGGRRWMMVPPAQRSVMETSRSRCIFVSTRTG